MEGNKKDEIVNMAKMDEDGSIRIPRKIRLKSDIEPGDMVFVEYDSESKRIVVKKPERNVSDLLKG